MRKIYSFDVYDTALVRNVAHPIDIFYALAEKLLLQSDVGTDKEQIAEIVRRRREAALQARIAAGKEEVGIEEIYYHLGDMSLWNIDCQKMMRTEMELELQAVRPIGSTLSKIAELRSNGQQIIFISDMYLPRDIIRQMLIVHGMARDEDHIYVSGDIGYTKATGKLFQYVLSQEGIAPRQLFHCGDNYHSDVKMPAKLGICSSFFRHSQLNRHEMAMLQINPLESLLPAYIAGASRATRLMCADNSSQILAGIVADAIGPLFTCFVAWVLQHSRDQGVERLYFVARDGEIFLKIAQRLSNYMPTPDCRYLYGSRQAWHLPSLPNCDRKYLDWLVLQQHSTAPRHLLRKLHIEPAEIEPALQKYQLAGAVLDQQLDEQQLAKFWQLLTTPPTSTLIEQKSAQARKMALAYFQQEGMCSATRWALVDSGWSLKSQRAFKRILANVDQRPLIGYYLALCKQRVSMPESGGYYAFLLQEYTEHRTNAPIQALFGLTRLLEEVFMKATHGSLLCYRQQNNKIVPYLQESNAAVWHRQFIDNLHHYILCYTEEIAKTGILEQHVSELKKAALTTLAQFLLTPTREQAQAISWMLVGDDQLESRYRNAARGLRLIDILPQRIQQFLGFNAVDFEKGYAWLEGSLAVSRPWIKLLFSCKQYLKYKATSKK